MKAILCALAALAATPAPLLAADLGEKPILAPAAAWVKPLPLPADDGKPNGAAVRLLLQDRQERLSPDGDAVYTETVVKVQTPQGLSALGTLTFPWKPDSGTLTVHKVHILRDGKVVDVLAAGPGLTVLRRENKLEYATLDGVLTAVVQPEGLQIGDILDVASTVTERDPALAGHSEGVIGAWPNEAVAHLHASVQWDSKRAMRWRATEGMPPPKPRTANGITTIELAADDHQPVVLPKDAPLRFSLPAFIEVSSYASWADLSALFAPLYAKAATLKPGSPLQAQIAAIAAASPDPARRAEAALALVQDKVRYVFLGMNDGGLVPADADATWQRRFGDCKGKTALLLALLERLGIEAEPAVVSTVLGDGMDQHLPMVGLFDHILVRAQIAGKTYWLDGTRLGDNHLDAIAVPPFEWALPVRPAGAALIRLDRQPPAKPLRTMRFRLDMTNGISEPIAFHLEDVTRGDQALIAHLTYQNLTPDARDHALRERMARDYSDVTVSTVSESWNAASGEEKIVMDGLQKFDWRYRRYTANMSGLGDTADFSRPPGPHRAAPFKVDFPTYIEVLETIRLPNGGVGFKIDAPDIAETIAGVDYHREVRLNGDSFTAKTSQRSVAEEFPAAQAPHAQERLRELEKSRADLTVTDLYRPTAQEIASLIAGTPKSAAEFVRRAAAHFHRREYAAAIADYDDALALDPKNLDALLWRGTTRGRLGQTAAALADFNAVLAIDPKNARARIARGGVVVAANPAEAKAEADKMLAASDALVNQDPANPDALAQRARIEQSLARSDDALKDSAAALRLAPGTVDLYLLRARIFAARGEQAKELAEVEALVTAVPDNDYAHVVAGAIYTRLHNREAAAKEFDRAIGIKPTSYAYLTRANNRERNDLAGRKADIAAALKIDPADPEAVESQILFDIETHDYSGAIMLADKAIALTPRDGLLFDERGMAYAASGQSKRAEQDFGTAETIASGDAEMLNSYCWEKAADGVALDRALANCDAALKIKPDAAMILDSRGLVLLRLGRYAEAIASYDAALKISPTQMSSLYGRGQAKLRAGRGAEGEADILAAKKAWPAIERQFAGYGIAARS